MNLQPIQELVESGAEDFTRISTPPALLPQYDALSAAELGYSTESEKVYIAGRALGGSRQLADDLANAWKDYRIKRDIVAETPITEEKIVELSQALVPVQRAIAKVEEELAIISTQGRRELTPTRRRTQSFIIPDRLKKIISPPEIRAPLQFLSPAGQLLTPVAPLQIRAPPIQFLPPALQLPTPVAPLQIMAPQRQFLSPGLPSDTEQEAAPLTPVTPARFQRRKIPQTVVQAELLINNKDALIAQAKEVIDANKNTLIAQANEVIQANKNALLSQAAADKNILISQANEVIQANKNALLSQAAADKNILISEARAELETRDRSVEELQNELARANEKISRLTEGNTKYAQLLREVQSLRPYKDQFSLLQNEVMQLKSRPTEYVERVVAGPVQYIDRVVPGPVEYVDRVVVEPGETIIKVVEPVDYLSLKEQVNTSVSTISRLESLLEEEKRRAGLVIISNQEWEKAKIAYEKQIDNLLQEFEQKNAALIQERSKSASLSTTVTTLEQNLSLKNNDILILQTAVEQTRSEYQACFQQRQSCAKELAACVQNCGGQNIALEAEVARQTNLIEMRAAEMERNAALQSAKANEAIVNNQTLWSQWAAEKNNLQIDLNSLKNQLDGLSVLNSRLSNENQELNRRLETAQAEYIRLIDAARFELNQRISELETTLIAKETSIRNLQSVNAALENDKLAAILQASKVPQTVTIDLSAEHTKEFQNKIDELNAALKTNMDSSQSTKTLVTSLESERDALRAELKELEARFMQAGTELMGIKQQLAAELSKPPPAPVVVEKVIEKQVMIPAAVPPSHPPPSYESLFPPPSYQSLFPPVVQAPVVQAPVVQAPVVQTPAVQAPTPENKKVDINLNVRQTHRRKRTNKPRCEPRPIICSKRNTKSGFTIRCPKQ